MAAKQQTEKWGGRQARRLGKSRNPVQDSMARAATARPRRAARQDGPDPVPELPPEPQLSPWSGNTIGVQDAWQDFLSRKATHEAKVMEEVRARREAQFARWQGDTLMEEYHRLYSEVTTMQLIIDAGKQVTPQAPRHPFLGNAKVIQPEAPPAE
jgi:hypothetical protein